jgi:hypothetical protein
MPIVTTCPNCSAHVNTDNAQPLEVMRCEKCGHQFRVPDPPMSASADPGFSRWVKFVSLIVFALVAAGLAWAARSASIANSNKKFQERQEREERVRGTSHELEEIEREENR